MGSGRQAERPGFRSLPEPGEGGEGGPAPTCCEWVLKLLRRLCTLGALRRLRAECSLCTLRRSASSPYASLWGSRSSSKLPVKRGSYLQWSSYFPGLEAAGSKGRKGALGASWARHAEPLNT